MKDIQHPEDLSCPKFNGRSCDCRCCHDIVDLESQMLEMARRLMNMKAAKNKTHSLINRRLPPEILSAVFLDCLPTSEELDYCCKIEHPFDFYPLQLGNVCSHWRDIAWSTPDLWCQLSLALYSDQLEEKAVLLADLAREWLDRSGGLPLSVHILMQSDDNAFYNNQTNFTIQHPVIEVLKMYSHRWQDLSLRMWVPCISQMGIDVAEIPILRTLKMWPMGKAHQRLWKDIKIEPQVLDLHLHELVASSPVFGFFGIIDWKNINDIAVDGLPWGDYIRILKSASQLTRFTIHNFSSRGPFSASGEVLHSKLQYFKIRGKIEVFANYTPDRFENFIASLNFPALKELDYDVGRFSAPSSLFECHFPETFLGHIKDLEKLTIQLSDSLEGYRYIDLLKKWPSLNYLFLIDSDSFYRGRSASEWSYDGNPSLLRHLSAWKGSEQENADQPEPFGYRAHHYEPPWERILMILGPLSKVTNRYRRLLNTIHIEIEYNNDALKDTVGRDQLWEAKKAGVTITLKSRIR